MKKWFLAFVVTGLLTSNVVYAKGYGVVNNELAYSHLKPFKKYKKKRYSNKVANKARRTWHKI